MLKNGIILLIVGLAEFILWSVRLFQGRVRKSQWLMSCVIAAMLIGCGVWNANIYYDLGLGVPKTFSAENWSKTALSQRHFMVDDLQNSTNLVGMSADEVRELLGTPDYADTDTCLSYTIAQNMDDKTLDLTLENGIVTKVEEKDH